MIAQVLLILLFLYTGLIIFLLYIAIVFPRKQPLADKIIEENVSIVIPCKNEALNLPTLFSSLHQQQFNAKIEIIIVDDYSIDTTKELVQQFKKHATHEIKYIHNNFSPASDLTSKQQAIDAGIREAGYDIIVLTDADMFFDRTWLQSFFRSFDHTTDLIYGHTAIRTISSSFSFLQSFQLEFLFSIAAIFHFAGIKGSCMGNNLMVRKKTYLKYGGQKAIGYSITEDRALLCHFYKCKRNIAITTPFFPKAFTLPHTKLSLFIDQMLRWAKGGFKNGQNLLFYASLFSIESVSLILSILGWNNFNCTLLTFFNFFVTWAVVALMFKKNHAPVSPLFFPLFYLFLIVETLLFPILLLVKNKIVWKGNEV